MKLARGKAELRAALGDVRSAGGSVGLVPTMGALHDGHAALIRAARDRCDHVVLTIFVNPAQFGPGEDLEGYPRDERRDLEIAEGLGVDLVFAPDAGEVYPPGFASAVEVGGRLTEVLEGDPARRGPAHFRGVTTVVAKLFNLVSPDVAFFGQKDAQQALVIKRMAADLDFAVEIAVVETIREPGGLALSSRNAYLDDEARARAQALSAALREIEAAVAAGATGTEEALEAGAAILARAGIEPEYLEARDAGDLEVVSRFNGRPVLVAVAAKVGRARLIDNLVIGGSGEATPDGETERKEGIEC